ncbi:MAG: glycosyltransferase [Burkholderiaceae bacterium]
MKQVQLIYFDAGGGHRAAATALEAAIEQQGPPWSVRRVNLFEALDPQNLFERFTGMRPESYYNKRLARGWTAGLAGELKVLQGMVRLGHEAMTRRLQRHWLETEPDLVVSLIPNFNRALCESLAAAVPGVPYVTILTDFADFPPNFWIEEGQRQHFICGTPHAVQQARAMGYTAAQVHATSGMIVRPDFYRVRDLDRRAERIRLGLDPERPTGLVMFGGHGSRAMLGIAERLDSTQLIMLCGHNAALARALQSASAASPRHVVGFTREVAYFMQLSDFFIGKPGPGSISEALQQGLPVIVERNAWTMPQERYNTQWVLENRVGVVLKSFRSVDTAVSDLTSRLDELRANVRRTPNRAVFEIPAILARILDSGDKNLPAGSSESGLASMAIPLAGLS